MKYKQDIQRAFTGLKRQGQDTCVKADNKTKINNAIDSDGKIELKRTGGTCPICTDKQGVISSKNLTTTSAKLHDGCKCQLVPLLSKKQRIKLAESLVVPEKDNFEAIRRELGKAETQGLIKYEKSLNSFRKSDQRDLIAHLCLLKNGEDVVVRAENAPEGFSNIDLTMNGELWEIKSPVGKSNGVIERNIKRALKQFSHTYPKPTVKTRMIFNNIYLQRKKDEIINELQLRKKEHSIESIIAILDEKTIIKI